MSQCLVCFETFNDASKLTVPRVYTCCGHSFCTRCVRRLLRRGCRSCPECRTKLGRRQRHVDDFPKNYALLMMIEEQAQHMREAHSATAAPAMPSWPVQPPATLTVSVASIPGGLRNVLTQAPASAPSPCVNTPLGRSPHTHSLRSHASTPSSLRSDETMADFDEASPAAPDTPDPHGRQSTTAQASPCPAADLQQKLLQAQHWQQQPATGHLTRHRSRMSSAHGQDMSACQ
ncbi:hypothetical protein WJX72_011045 [[Myrmecia] bisecta]|uniref:RING-type domain-containing protein n=1 Tax=[Myrmecia] bisecta TaxID=41462 RepID=A0AAW1R9U1_9CHLO